MFKLAVSDRVQAAVWFARTEPQVPEILDRARPVEDELRALVAQGEDSPTRIMHRLRQRGYTGGVEPIKDFLYPGWR